MMDWGQAFGVAGGTAALFLAGCFFIVKHYFGKLTEKQAEIDSRIANLPKELKIHKELKGIEHGFGKKLENFKAELLEDIEVGKTKLMIDAKEISRKMKRTEEVYFALIDLHKIVQSFLISMEEVELNPRLEGRFTEESLWKIREEKGKVVKPAEEKMVTLLIKNQISVSNEFSELASNIFEITYNSIEPTPKSLEDRDRSFGQLVKVGREVEKMIKLIRKESASPKLPPRLHDRFENISEDGKTVPSEEMKDHGGYGSS